MLALRLAPSPREGFDAKIAPDAAPQATCQMGNYMVGSFHPTRLTRLSLAHQITQIQKLKSGLTARPDGEANHPLDVASDGP